MQRMGQLQTGKGARCSARRGGVRSSAGERDCPRGAPTAWNPCASGPAFLWRRGLPASWIWAACGLPRPRECGPHRCDSLAVAQPLLDHCPSLGALSLSLKAAQCRLLRGGSHVETERGPPWGSGAARPPSCRHPLFGSAVTGHRSQGAEMTPSLPRSSAGQKSETGAGEGGGASGETAPSLQPASPSL